MVSYGQIRSSLLEHVERVRDEGERADSIAHDELLGFVSAKLSGDDVDGSSLGVRPCGVRECDSDRDGCWL